MAAQSVERPLPPDPLPSSVVDSHCHLDMCAADGGPTVQEALAAAAEVGVTKMIQVGCDVQGSRWAARSPRSTTTSGPLWRFTRMKHQGSMPAEVSRCWRPPGEIGELAELPQVRAIGETGMDFFRTETSGRAIQESRSDFTSVWPSDSARRWSSTTATLTMTF